jgi:predicted CXXCH cytochrome family protein
MRKFVFALAFIVVALAAAGGLFYELALPGLYSARQTPSKAEVEAATWLLRHSVAEHDAARVEPLAPSEADIAAGASLFQQKCASCHGFDARGHTMVGQHVYPRVPSLHDLMPTLTDGQAFAYIRDGIRNTAMPAWNLPEKQIWQVVLFLRHLPPTAGRTPDIAASVEGARFVGSAACKSCHQDIYKRWSETRMANVVRDPRTHPDAFLPDFSKPDPALTFTKADVAFVYGSRWKQRYFTKRGDDFFPLPAQWDVANKRWLPYHVPDKADWWVSYYPKDNMERPTGPLCDGCHSVNYDIKTKTPTEWNVGCEDCHGAGGDHVAHPLKANIINPARLDYVAANDTCIRCHSQGRPLANPIDGKYYDWPVGFQQGKRLADFWRLEDHNLGELTFTHFPDGTAHKNRMQGNDFVQSLMYTRGVTCISCHDPHGSENPSMVRAKGNALCLTCHAPNAETGPFAATIEAHTHHKPGSAGSECVACHMPKIEEEMGPTKVHAHTFRFIPPSDTETLGVPNACNLCHKDKSVQWTKQTLAGWHDRSPWRVAQ